MTIAACPVLGAPVAELRLPDAHIVLTPGAELTAQEGTGRRRRRIRFMSGRLTPKGWEITGWDGDRVRTFRADQIIDVHLTPQIAESPDEFRAPSRRKGRR